MNAVAYRPADGRIFYLLTMPDMESILASVDTETYSVLEVVEEMSNDLGDNFYVVDGALAPRPEHTVTLTGMRLDSLPVGGTLLINYRPYEITADFAELSFPLPGKYRIEVENFPTKSAKFEVVIP